MALTSGLTQRLKKIALTAGLVGILSVSLAACGGGGANNNSGNNTTQPTAAPTAMTQETPAGDDANMVEQTVVMEDFRFEPSDVEAAGGKIRFTVTNEGDNPHNLVISDASGVVGRTKTFNKGEGPEVLEVDLQPGTYKMLCDVPGHEQAGMVGTLTVTDR